MNSTDDPERSEATPIAIVEAEKTAVICSQLKPKIRTQEGEKPLIWMATGGMNQLNLEVFPQSPPASPPPAPPNPPLPPQSEQLKEMIKDNPALGALLSTFNLEEI